MMFPTDEVLADALLWEEGVCLECGEVSDPLEDLTRLHECEGCGSQWCTPAAMLVRFQEVFEAAKEI